MKHSQQKVAVKKIFWINLW